jgi:hypothetical protein
MFIGGYLVKRWKLSTKDTARFVAIIARVAVFSFLALLIGCDTNRVAGATSRGCGCVFKVPESFLPRVFLFTDERFCVPLTFYIARQHMHDMNLTSTV